MKLQLWPGEAVEVKDISTIRMLKSAGQSPQRIVVHLKSGRDLVSPALGREFSEMRYSELVDIALVACGERD